MNVSLKTSKSIEVFFSYAEIVLKEPGTRMTREGGQGTLWTIFNFWRSSVVA